jgi:hypothetical protein
MVWTVRDVAVPRIYKLDKVWGKEMRPGVAQGSSLSPTLYNIYINGGPPQTPGVT